MMKDLNEKLDELGNITPKLVEAMKFSASLIRDDIIKSMDDTPLNMDRAYFTHNKSIPHHPSMPDNPPARDSGALVQSLHWDVSEKDGKIVAEIGSTMTESKYPIYLEHGTSRMAPRPWLGVAVSRNAENVKDIISEVVFNDKS